MVPGAYSHTVSDQKGSRMSGIMSFGNTAEDANESLLESPQSRSFVQQLSNKYEKSVHDSSDNLSGIVSHQLPGE